MSLTLFLLLHSLTTRPPLLPVFTVATKPAVITAGVTGSALTVNLAFGDQEVEEWLNQLEPPYPLLFVDLDWAERYPSLIEIISEKNITIGLLGKNGDAYMNSKTLLEKQLLQYEEIFQAKPLWFRTADERFPKELVTTLLQKEINALGSSIRWTGEDLALEQKGEIVSVSSYKNDQLDFTALQQLANTHTFETIDQVLFNVQSKKKKFPN